MSAYSAEYVAIYDRIGQADYARQQADALIEQLTARATLAPACRVLDLACGTGAAALRFAALGCDVYGIDQSAAMLEQAHYKAEQRGLPLHLVQADIRHLPPSLPSADLITCLNSLNELPEAEDLARVIANAVRLLRPGGVFAFDLLMEAGYRAWHEQDSVLYEDHDYLVYQRLTYDQTSQRAARRIVWLVRAIDLWWRSEELHRERCWSAAALASMVGQVADCIGSLYTLEYGPVDISVSKEGRNIYCIQKAPA